MEKALTVVNNAAALNFDDGKMLETLKATVAKDATTEEFAMFVQYCKSTGLNPFKKEIWFIKPKPYRNKSGELVAPPVQMMTGINGFLAIANSHPAYDGMEEEIIRDEKSGKPIKAICKAWRKDRRFPAIGEALFNEYYKPGNYGKESIWDKLPSVMISKVAQSLALRKAFPQELNGLYTPEEMPAEYAVTARAEPVEPEKPALPAGIVTADKLPPKETKAAKEPKALTATRKAMKDGSAYEYDGMLLGQSIENEESRKKITDIMLKAGAVNGNGVIFCATPIPELSYYLIKDPNNKAAEETFADGQPPMEA